MLGYDREKNVVNLNDTADLYAYLYDDADAPVNVDTIVQVDFLIEKPDRSRVSLAGQVEDDGAGFVLFSDTDLTGEYRVVATFIFDDGRKQSTTSDFQVDDPFQNPEVLDWEVLTEDEKYDAYERLVAEKTWDRFEDLFDSTDGGPWMRDMTMNVFGPQKIRDFIDEALFDINVYNPPTDFDIAKFAQPINNRTNTNMTLIVQGTMLAVIRHLMRVYTEQPLPTGGQITYEDRRDYLQRWGTIYQIEWNHYDHLVKMWKRQFLDLGKNKVLVHNKAGRLLPAPLRTRNIGRGYY